MEETGESAAIIIFDGIALPFDLRQSVRCAHTIVDGFEAIRKLRATAENCTEDVRWGRKGERERERVHCSRHIIVNDEFSVPNVCTHFYSWKHDITYDDTRWVAVVGTQAFEIELNVSQKWTMLREREKKVVRDCSACACVLARTAHRVRHNSYTKRKCWWCEFRLACGVPCSDIHFGSSFTFIYALASNQFNIPFISHPKIHICTAMVG